MGITSGLSPAVWETDQVRMGFWAVMGNSPSQLFASTIVKISLPSSFCVIAALSGVFAFIFFSAGLINVRFISAKLDLCDSGSMKRSDSHSWVVTHTPLERY